MAGSGTGLRGIPRTRSRQDAIRKLHLEEPPLSEALHCLVRVGFVATESRKAHEQRFIYRPASPLLAELADHLAEALDRNPLHVFELMNRHAMERLRTSAARTFASAFVLGKKKDG